MVVGSSGAGKTTVMRLISKALKAVGIDVNTVWGVDGHPAFEMSEENWELRASAIGQKTEVVLTEFQLNRAARKDEDGTQSFSIFVDYLPGVGYSTTLKVAGIALRHDFGEYSYSQERARAIAERLSAELAVPVIDNTKNKYTENQNHRWDPTAV